MVAAFGLTTLTCCPKQGQRAAELVAGKLTEVLEALAASAMATLMRKVQVRLSAIEWGHIVEEVARVKAFLLCGLQVKYDFCRRFPWILTGLCHHLVDVARDIGRTILAMWDALTDLAKTLQHSATIEFLTGTVGHQLYQFAVLLCPLSLLTQLEFLIGGLSFIPITGYRFPKSTGLKYRHLPKLLQHELYKI